MRSFLVSLFFSIAGAALLAAPSNPNLAYILADDLGYGDVPCPNPQRGKIKTPHRDKLAAQGMTFTDAHSGSSVCTPPSPGIYFCCASTASDSPSTP